MYSPSVYNLLEAIGKKCDKILMFNKIAMYENGRFLFRGGSMLRLHTDRRIKISNGLVSKRELVIGKE